MNQPDKEKKKIKYNSGGVDNSVFLLVIQYNLVVIQVFVSDLPSKQNIG